MAETEELEGEDQQLRRLAALEHRARECFEVAESSREKLAALKTIADLVLAQLKLKKEMVPKEEVESVEFYEEQLRNFTYRVNELSRRRRGL